MHTPNLTLISINKFSEETPYHFFIPSYQRGYRWTKTQVTDLLTDIKEFAFDATRKTGGFYCLQPLVVKKRGSAWEVIDGQQRLTTVYLLLKYFKSRMAEEHREPLYTVEYETRKGSAAYLKSLTLEDSEANVDYFHMYNAYNTIKEWFKSEQHRRVNDFETALLFDTKFIWYEVRSDIDSRDVFTRLNIGKIPLTNAELIKALFLMPDNFEGNERLITLRQIEIAGEWDRIEATLREDDFWGFISNTEHEYDNRIEFIFDIISDKGRRNKEDRDATFRYFYDQLKGVRGSEVIWKKVRGYFLTFQEWYADRELFHLIGFLVTAGERIDELIIESYSFSKIKFREVLMQKIKQYVNVQVRELDYGDKGDHRDIRNVLLLYNVISIVNNSKSNYRFHFARFKTEKWDIEHIHAVKTEMPEREEHRREWMKETLLYIKDAQIESRIRIWLGKEKKDRMEEFPRIYEDVLKLYELDEQPAEWNDISNLTLLDAGTNRGYKNAIFPVKRNKIIQKDQNGTFIPFCTKNVFLKYYTPSVEHMDFWSNADRAAYLEAIERELKEYLPLKNTSYN